eukprot:CAMPEP_0204351714 /NCGR_PEP_ID=MMETSP0469-20131031/31329_1 /ASSEMBLY_ACC=CAM_ASM_000384 /TAXON_ID=2969 /ORGANISM="Oxyrrhis marina" /LENGTH=37 /DNA_ID= /DNA_START= /DNA_END= /DNA_ORIENTATION=
MPEAPADAGARSSQSWPLEGNRLPRSPPASFGCQFTG